MHPGTADPRKPIGASVRGYGQGQVFISAQEMMQVDADVLAQRLIELFRSPRYQPPVLPAAAAQILKLSATPNVDARDIVEVLGTDPLLMGRVMATAQSPAYGGQGNVRTLQDAVRRLGLRGLRNLTMEAALQMRVFRTPTYSECMDSIRRHSLVTAHLSHLVARSVRVDPNEAFLAGLVHDVGTAGGLLVLADGHRKESAPSLGRFWSSVDRAHAVGGAQMVRMWGMADDLAACVALHHEPGRNNPMAATVCLAEHMAQLLGARCQYDAGPGEGGRKNDADVTEAAHLFTVRDVLRITAAQMTDLFEAAKALYPLIG